MTARRALAALLVLLAATQVTWVGQAAPAPAPVKGLAQLNWSAAGIGDRALLGVESWYAWGLGACAAPSTWATCVPMNRNWDVAAQTYCPPHLLLGNEPTNPEPAGHPISATVAASVTVAIETACPATAIVAGNIHINNTWGDGIAAARQWLLDYLAAYQTRAGHPFGGVHRLGLHCYAQWSDDCLNRLRDTLAALPYAGNYWLTEFGLYGAYPYTSGAELARFLTLAPLRHPRLERYYLWTNRSDPACCSGWPFELVNGDGTLTAMGQVYAAWEPPSVAQTWMPVTAGRPQGYP